MDVYKKLGIDKKKLFGFGGYCYLINEYIPDQGGENMKAFIELGFSPVNYVLWKMEQNGLLKEELSKALRKKIKKMFGTYPKGGLIKSINSELEKRTK